MPHSTQDLERVRRSVAELGVGTQGLSLEDPYLSLPPSQRDLIVISFPGKMQGERLTKRKEIEKEPSQGGAGGGGGVWGWGVFRQ